MHRKDTAAVAVAAWTVLRLEARISGGNMGVQMDGTGSDQETIGTGLVGIILGDNGSRVGRREEGGFYIGKISKISVEEPEL